MLNKPKRLAAIFVSLLSLTSLATSALVANAATINAPVSVITIDRATEETPRPVYTVFENALINFDWAVPDDAVAGDTFSIALPNEIHAENPSPFSLLTDTGEVVASAAWSFEPDTVTFTLNNYVETHDNVKGSGYFTVRFNYLLESETDTNYDLLFTMNDGGTKTVPITLKGIVSEPPTGIVVNSVYGMWSDNADQGREQPVEAIRWIVSPVGQSTETGESPAYPDGISFDIWLSEGHTVSATGIHVTGTDGLTYPADKYTLTPVVMDNWNDESQTAVWGFRFTSTGALEANERPSLSFRSDLTDNSLLNYSIHGTFTSGDAEPLNLGAQVVRNTSGGTGNGTDDPNAVYTFSGVVFIDTNENGIQDRGEVGFAGADLTASRPSVRTFPSGSNGTFASNDVHLDSGDIDGTVTLTIPTGYKTTTALTQPMFVVVNGTVTNPRMSFGIVPSEVIPPVDPPIIDPPVVNPPVVEPPTVPEEVTPTTPETTELAFTGSNTLALAPVLLGFAIVLAMTGIALFRVKEEQAQD